MERGKERGGEQGYTIRTVKEVSFESTTRDENVFLINKTASESVGACF